MMKSFFFLTLSGLIWLNTVSQVPEAFKYQAVARNSSGEILTNRKVSFRITFRQRIVNGIVVYAELHSGTTNNFGLINLEIGKGAPVHGTFSSIKWGADEFYLQVEMDPEGGAAYQDMGITQLLSVPYALYARNVENEADGSVTNEIQDISLEGNMLKLSGSTATVDLSRYLDNTDSQKLDISGSTLSISGGNSVALPAGGTADNWGSQVVKTDATLSGEGTTTIPLKIARQSATNGQVLKWDGTSWLPGVDLTGSSLWTESDSNIYRSSGKVGIRTWTPQYDLDVNGNIRAIGSVYYGGAAGSANGTAYTKPDYVFGEEYEALTPEQIAEFLQKESHLPWVTSSKQEMKENGGATDMTRMAFETLEAVENLQIQLIKQNKLIGELKTENDLLKKRLEKIEQLVGTK